MDLHQTFEVLDGAHAEFIRGVLVAHKDGRRMLLEGRDRPHVADPLLDRLVQGERLVGARDQDHHLKQD